MKQKQLRKLISGLFLWWFLYVAPSGVSTVVGPFADNEGCERIRISSRVYVGTSNSKCWSDENKKAEKDER